METRCVRGSYGAALAGALLGYLARLPINALVLRPPPYHCYEINALVVFMLVVVVIVGPLIAQDIAISKWLRWVALGVTAAVLAASVNSWSESEMMPCGPL